MSKVKFIRMLIPKVEVKMRKAPFYPALIVVLIIGFLLGSLTASSTALGVGGAGTVTGGMVNACVGLGSDSAAVKMSGRVITPSEVLLVPPSNDQSCDATETTLKLASYSNTIVVSASSGVSETNGTKLRETLNGITGASADNPYLLKLEPGVYYLGIYSLMMKSYVDIEGSGQGVTRIVVNGGPSVIQAINNVNSEVRDLALNIDTEGTVSAVLSLSPDFRLTNVTVKATGTSSFSTVTVAGFNGIGTIKNSTISSTHSGGTKSYAVYSNGSGTVTVLNSVLQGGNSSIKVDSGSGKIANSQLLNAAYAGNVKCVGVYDANYDPVQSNCSPTV